ncbi:Cytochrome P450 90B1 [Acorus calamus]|uniref:Cytochrome P450 90B1 n=1 Tax=Acorus calamus TaxID=4465 RepID=A0AAV9CJ07_ACOCL|nr:Cytochrome P450 90B1 [Acorus calamus]
MSLVALLLCFSPLILVLIHTWRSSNSSYNTQNIPKGSSGWPFIGELIPFLKPHPSIHIGPFIEQRISKYGKIFRSQLPGRRVIFSGDAELNRIVFQNTGQKFKNDWPRNFEGLFGKYSIALLEGEAHRIKRSLFVSFLSIERIRGSSLREVDLQASFILDSWKEKSLVYFKEETRKFAFNMAVKLVMNCGANNPEVDQLRREYINIYKGLASSLPINFPGTTYRKALQSRSNVLKYINQKVQERQQQINDGCEGFDIPNGYTVIPALAAVHMDPSLFDDPQCFNPWRWQKESSSPARTNNIMSFGGGLRLCPGMELAKVELSVFIHRLVLAYAWETEEPDPPMALPMVDFARGLPMKIRPYNPSVV